MNLNEIKVSYQNTSDYLPSDISVASVSSTLASLRQGNFDEAVQLYLKMVEDSRLMAVLDTRISGVFEDKFEILNGSKADNQIVLKGLDDAELKRIWIDYILMGVGLGQIDWVKLPSGKWQPKIKHYLLSGLRYDQETDLYFLITIKKDEVKTQQRINEIEKSRGFLPISYLSKLKNVEVILVEDDPKWILIKNGSRGHLYGKIYSVSKDWLNKQLAQADLNHFNQDQNGRIFKFFVPKDSSAEDSALFANALRNMKKNSVIKLPRDSSEYESYDVESMDPTNSSVYSSYENQIKRSETNYAIAILSNNLTTEVDGGSFAAAETHADVAQQIYNSDKEILYKNLNEQYIERYKEINNANYTGQLLCQIDTNDEIIKQFDILNQIISINDQLRAFSKTIDINSLLDSLNISFIKDVESEQVQ